MDEKIEEELKKRGIFFKYIINNSYLVTLTNKNSNDVLHMQQSFPNTDFVITNMKLK